LDVNVVLHQIVRNVMKRSNINLLNKMHRTNGGGGGKAPAMPAPAAPAPPPPPPADNGPDPAMQAEIEKQRALRYKAGQIGSNTDTTGQQQNTGTDQNKTTLLGA